MMEVFMKQQLDMQSRIKDIYQNPVGHDILQKLLLQLNKSEKLITNPILANLKVVTLAKLTKKSLGEDFFVTLFDLLNNETDFPGEEAPGITQQWWKEAVFYQIYPRSFQDSDADGIGDLKGIESRLDYLKELGIDAVWLSPVYDSPNDDNGYDIRDYYAIMKEFGTMEDFDRLLEGIHKRGMRLIMDLVINHTSDEHPWFTKALGNEASDYRDYYYFSRSKDKNPPNNWTSAFSGSAWNYYEEQDIWGLHLFSKKQMDLNWENPKLRKDIITMIRWWLEKGVDGFRMDVINYISKKDGLPDGNEVIGKMMGYYGIEHYFYGPRLHEYLQELKKEAFEPYGAFTVGETPGVGMQMSRLLTADYRRELDMVFSFDHLETPGHVRFDDYLYDLNYYKKYIAEWMERYGNSCWMSLFFENHDNPRMVSKINPDPAYREVLAKLLAMLQLTLKGTPFIYQGQEIGAINQAFHSIEELRDVESLNFYRETKDTLGAEVAFRKVLNGSRDHSRTPMQWEDTEYAGFTTKEPWIGLFGDQKGCNVKAQLKDPDSVLNFYRKLIRIRKNNKALVYGEFQAHQKKRKNCFIYQRSLQNAGFLIECNLGSKPIPKKYKNGQSKLILSNYEGQAARLRPYEANLYQLM